MKIIFNDATEPVSYTHLDVYKRQVNTLDNVIEVVGKLADVALPPLTKALDFAGENLDLVAASAAAAFTAFKGYKIITNTTSALSKGIKAWKKAEAAVDAYNVIQMACTARGVVSNATLTVCLLYTSRCV